MTIKLFDLLHNNITNENIRILHMTDEYAVVARVKTPRKLGIFTMGRTTICQQINDGTLTVVEETETIVDVDMLGEDARVKFLRNKDIVDTVTNVYGPDYVALDNKNPKPIILELERKYGIHHSTILRIINKFLHSGCKYSSLLKTVVTPTEKDKVTAHKRGRKSSVQGAYGKNLTEQDKQNINKYIKRYLAIKPATAVNCYDDMIIDLYTVCEFDGTQWVSKELPPDQCPSLRQFQYRLNRDTTKRQRGEAKEGKRKFNNDNRPLTGTALSNISGPGDVFEMDACELDIAVVSETDRNKTVGSPVIYFLIDVFSKLIIAASISFDNNSIIALTQCLKNLVEDKVDIFASYGLSLVTTKSGLTIHDVMPVNYKPHTVRVDHGSDFISKEAQRIAKENNIQIDYVTPATGSYKSIVERSFRYFQEHFDDLVHNIGGKERSGVRKHNKQAKLTISEVKEIMYRFIYFHNMSEHKTKYPLSPDMVSKGISNIPSELWRYGITRYGYPAVINDRNQYLYSLLTPVDAKITRNGIEYKGLRYIPDINNDKDIETKMIMGKTIPMKIRIDLRDISTVFYLRDGVVCAARMVDDIIHRELTDMTWAEFETLKQTTNKLSSEKSIETAQLRRMIRKLDKETIKNAKSASGKGKSDDKNMSVTRAEEKTRVEKEHRILTLPTAVEEEKHITVTEITKNTSAMSDVEKEAYLKLLEENLIGEDD